MFVGTRIKIIREFRGLTQKELGLMCSFGSTQADVRIRQYEMNKRTPKEDMLIKIANSLDVSIHAIRPYFVDDDSVNPDTSLDLLEVLFWMEEFQQNFEIISLAGKTSLGDSSICSNEAIDGVYENHKNQTGMVFKNLKFNKYLSNWSAEKQRYSEGKITLDEYREWKFRFPLKNGKFSNTFINLEEVVQKPQMSIKNYFVKITDFDKIRTIYDFAQDYDDDIMSLADYLGMFKECMFKILGYDASGYTITPENYIKLQRIYKIYTDNFS